MKNITYPVCDDCGAIITMPEGGFFIFGRIFRATWAEGQEALINSGAEEDEQDEGIALCEVCMSKKLKPPRPDLEKSREDPSVTTSHEEGT